MPILDAEEYEEILTHAKDERPTEDGEFVAADGEVVVCFSAFASRDTLSNVADEAGLDEEAWKKFKWAEEYAIEAIVEVATGEIIKARLV